MKAYEVANDLIEFLIEFLDEEDVDYLYNLCWRYGAEFVLYEVDQKKTSRHSPIYLLTDQADEVSDIQKKVSKKMFACMTLCAVWSIFVAFQIDHDLFLSKGDLKKKILWKARGCCDNLKIFDLEKIGFWAFDGQSPFVEKAYHKTQLWYTMMRV